MKYAVIPFTEGKTRKIIDKLASPNVRIYSNNYQESALFVDFDGSVNELADIVGFDDNEMGHGAILRVEYFQGYAAKSFWEWLE